MHALSLQILLAFAVLFARSGQCAVQPVGTPAGVRSVPDIRHYDSDTGLPQNSVTALLEDRAGYLWVGTYGGLARYDGHGFRLYASAGASGPPSDRITALLEDAGGRIWIGTENAGVGRLDPDGRFLRPARCAPSCLVRQLMLGPQEQVYAYSEQGVVQVAADLQTQPYPSALTPAPHLAAHDGAGTLYLANHAQVIRIDGRGEQVLPALPVRAPIDQLYWAQRRLWAVTPDDLYVLDGERGWRALGPEPVRKVYRVGDAPRGGLWISTHQGLLQERDDALQLRPDMALPMDLRSPLLLDDRYGTRWIGTDGQGLLRVHPPVIGGLGGPGTDWTAPTMAVHAARDGSVWIGGFCSGLWRYRDSRLAQIALPEDADGCVWTLAAAGGENLLAAYARGQIVRLSPAGDVLQRWQVKDEPRVRALHLDAQGTLWIGGSRGVYRSADGLAPVLVPELGATEIATLVPARAGGFWVGGKTGLVRWQDDRVQQQLQLRAHGAPPFVRAVFEDAQEVVWIGTYGNGLYRVAHGQQRHYTTQDGLVENVVSCIRTDDRGRLWLSGNRGISKLARADLTHDGPVRPALYTRTHGMPVSETNGGGSAACTTDAAGQLWFPLISGIAVVNPSHISAPPAHPGPRVDIDAVWVNGIAQDWRSGVRLDATASQLHVRYSAPDLDPAAALAFRHRVGDADWSATGNARDIHLSALPYGNYDLELASRSGHGEWTAAPTRIRLLHPTPWYRLVWVQLGAVLTVLTVIVLAARARVRALRTRAAWLDAQVAQRTTELASANARLQALAETDALTGTGNRRRFDAQLAAACSADAAIAVVVFDVDGFKAYNDHYGHPAGNACLQRIAAVTSTRAAELVAEADASTARGRLARIGGEEFALVLTGVGLVKALHLAEALRHAVELANLTHPRQPRVTISVGLAFADGNVAVEPSSLLRTADAALYRAKETGRNRVQWAAVGTPAGDSHAP